MSVPTHTVKELKDWLGLSWPEIAAEILRTTGRSFTSDALAAAYRRRYGTGNPGRFTCVRCMGKFCYPTTSRKPHRYCHVCYVLHRRKRSSASARRERRYVADAQSQSQR